jgi:hypothetical protein
MKFFSQPRSVALLVFICTLALPLSAHAACTSPAGVAGQLSLVGGVAKLCDGTTWGSFAASSPGGSNTQVQFNNSSAFGGDSALVWDNTNKRLGIGAAPSARLDVQASATGSATSAIFRSAGNTVSDVGTVDLTRLDGTVDLRMFGNANGTRIKASNDLYLHAGDTAISATNQFVTIKTTGLVGIGTSSPAYLMELGGSSPDVALHYTGAAAAGNKGKLVFTHNRTSDSTQELLGYIQGIAENNQSLGGMRFVTRTGSDVEVMRMLSSGYVGIGTTTPASPLQVNGAIRTTGYANPAASTGVGLELGYDGTQGVVQSYDRNNSVHKPTVYAASTHTFTQGPVGIGTTPTSVPIDIYSTTSGAWTARVRNMNATTPYGLYIQMGTDAGGGMAFGILNAAGTVWADYFMANGTNYLSQNGGFTQVGGSVRSPYFYDSDNTSYYIKASGTSVVYQLNATGVLVGQLGITTDTRGYNVNPLYALATGNSTAVYGVQNSTAGNAALFNHVGAGYYCYIGYQASYALLCSGPNNVASDGRLKKDVVALGDSEGLSAIMALRPVFYKWKDPHKGLPGHREIGFIAQEVEKVFPDLVGEMEQPEGKEEAGVKGKVKVLSYERIVPPVVKAVQELKAQFDGHEKAFKDLQEKSKQQDDAIAALKREIDILKQTKGGAAVMATPQRQTEAAALPPTGVVLSGTLDSIEGSVITLRMPVGDSQRFTVNGDTEILQQLDKDQKKTGLSSLKRGAYVTITLAEGKKDVVKKIVSTVTPVPLSIPTPIPLPVPKLPK